MALTEERRAALMEYCRLDDLTPEQEKRLEVCYLSAVDYMTAAGISEPEEGTPRRARFDLCVDYLVLDMWDRREVTITGSTSDNPAFRRMLNQLKYTDPSWSAV